jgi:PAS domain S-box-containing protein
VIADVVPAPVWLADPAGRPVFFNRAYRAYVGRSLSELVADPWAAVHETDRPAAVAAWADCLPTGTPYAAEFRLRRADGAFRWHVCEAAPDPGGSWVATLFDIHARRAAIGRTEDPASAPFPRIALWDTPLPDQTPVPGPLAAGPHRPFARDSFWLTSPGARMGIAPPLSVLVVDDHADGADALAALLQAVGHTVVTARNGPAALATAARWPPDVVVIEPGLPGQDGYAIAKEICNALGRRPLLIALTGLSSLEDRSRTEGFDHHFVKPGDPASLLSALAVRAARQAIAGGGMEPGAGQR